MCCKFGLKHSVVCRDKVTLEEELLTFAKPLPVNEHTHACPLVLNVQCDLCIHL